ncbi:MAG TPA: amino acid permease [Lactobacillus sp.]|nr:amino acid permease [Lactobacillus sp.]
MKKASSLIAFGFFTLTAAMLMSADEYPAFAQSGLLATLLLIIAGVFWFLPVALAAAQMATMPGWSDGGVYTWVKGTLGQRAGFIAVFFQWLQITVNFITMIYFIIGVFAYALNIPALNTNPWLKLTAFLVIYWTMTVLQLKGINNTDRLVKWTFILGIILPALILLIFSIVYLATGHPLQFALTLSPPSAAKGNTLTLIVPYILAFTGIEASASYVNNLKRPRRNYPIIMLTLVVFAIIIDSFGGLSVAAVVPLKDLSLNQGVIQAISAMVSIILGPTFAPLVKIIGLLMAIGMLGEISSWIVGPVKSLLVTAEDEILPPIFNQVNDRQVPVHLVMLQGIIVSIIAFILTVIFGGNNGAFAMGMALTVMLYLVTYLLLFSGFIVLNLTGKSRQASFKLPGGKIVCLITGFLGLISSALVFISTFFPTSNSQLTTLTYFSVMAGFFLLILGLTLWLYSRRRTSKTHRSWHVRHLNHDEVPRFTQIQGRGEHTIDPTDKT